MTSKFSRYKEWAERQRNKISNLTENQLKDAIKQQNKSSQEILLHLLNQIKSINTKIDNIDANIKALPNFYVPHKAKNDNSKLQKDAKRFRYLTSEIENPNDLPPVPDKLPVDFFEFI